MVDTVLSQDVSDLKAIGVRATPTFFVNGKAAASIDPAEIARMIEAAKR